MARLKDNESDQQYKQSKCFHKAIWEERHSPNLGSTTLATMSTTMTLLLLATVSVVMITQPFSTGASCDQSLINHAVDFILAQVTTKFADTVSLPNVTTSFLMNGGAMQLNSGHVLGLTTLRRVGDVLLNVTDKKMHIGIQLTFDNFTIAYDEYKVDALVIHSVGKWSASILENLINIQVTMHDKSLCLVEVNKVEFLKLSNFTMDLRSGCAMCNSITNWASTTTLNLFSEKLRLMVQGKLDTTLREMLKPSEDSVVCNQKTARR